MVGSRVLRTFAEVFREAIDMVGGSVDGGVGHMANQHVFGHAFGCGVDAF